VPDLVEKIRASVSDRQRHKSSGRDTLEHPNNLTGPFSRDLPGAHWTSPRRSARLESTDPGFAIVNLDDSSTRRADRDTTAVPYTGQTAEFPQLRPSFVC